MEFVNLRVEKRSGNSQWKICTGQWNNAPLSESVGHLASCLHVSARITLNQIRSLYFIASNHTIEPADRMSAFGSFDNTSLCHAQQFVLRLSLLFLLLEIIFIDKVERNLWLLGRVADR